MKASAHKRGISSGVRAVMIQASPIPRPHDRANFQHWYSATQRILMHLGKAWAHPRGEAQLPLFTRCREGVFPETQGAAKARRESGSTTSTMARTKPMVCTTMAAFSAPDSTMKNPDTLKRILTTETTMVSHQPHFFNIHSPTAV